MKNHGFLLLFLFSLGWVLAQQPVNSSAIKAHDPGFIPRSGTWSSTADLNTARHSDSDGVSYLTMGKDGSYFYVKDFYEGAIGKVYYRATERAEEQLIFEPDAYASAHDQIYTVAGLFPDPASKRLAIALSAADSEICDLVMVNLGSGVIDNYLSNISTLSISWLPDGEHILYHRWSADDVNDPKFRVKTTSFLHTIGTPEKEDMAYFSARHNDDLDIRDTELPLVYYDPMLNAVVGVVQTANGELKIYRQKGDLYAPEYWEPMALEGDGVVDFCVGDRFVYYKTNKNAENFRIVEAPMRWPDVSNADEVVAEFDGEEIADLGANRDGLYFTTRNRDGELKLWFKGIKSKTSELIALPVRARQMTIEVTDPATREVWLHIWEDEFWEMHFRFDAATGTFVRHSLDDTSAKRSIN